MYVCIYIPNINNSFSNFEETLKHFNHISVNSSLLATFYTLSFIDYIHEATHLLTLSPYPRYSPYSSTHATHAAHATHLHQPTQTYNIYKYNTADGGDASASGATRR